jgi:hypothetical protein
MQDKTTSGMRPDFDLIADSGDIGLYREAWLEFPAERETLEEIFEDLHAGMLAVDVMVSEDRES